MEETPSTTYIKDAPKPPWGWFILILIFISLTIVFVGNFGTMHQGLPLRAHRVSYSIENVIEKLYIENLGQQGVEDFVSQCKDISQDNQSEINKTISRFDKNTAAKVESLCNALMNNEHVMKHARSVSRFLAMYHFFGLAGFVSSIICSVKAYKRDMNLLAFISILLGLLSLFFGMILM